MNSLCLRRFRTKVLIKASAEIWQVLGNKRTTLDAAATHLYLEKK